MARKFTGLEKLAVVIFAHNEAAVIGDTVASITPLLASGDVLYVIADNCSDDTAAIARAGGAQVITRSNGAAQGKAGALSWFIDHHRNELEKYQGMVVLDADSIVERDFVVKIKTHPLRENLAYQCFVQPFYEDSPIGKLAALSELIDQKLSDRIRSWLHFPVRLRGTGMVLHPHDLAQVCSQLKTEVEDIALTLLLYAHGVSINRIDDVFIHDKKPMTRLFATQQRARWYRGQWHSIWVYRREILRIILKGPAGWSLLASLFLRPKWLISMLFLFLAILLGGFPLLSSLFWLVFLLGIAYMLLGLLLLPERLVYLQALLYGPVFIWMWLHSILLALRPSSWRRAR